MVDRALWPYRRFQALDMAAVSIDGPEHIRAVWLPACRIHKNCPSCVDPHPHTRLTCRTTDRALCMLSSDRLMSMSPHELWNVDAEASLSVKTSSQIYMPLGPHQAHPAQTLILGDTAVSARSVGRP